MSPVTGNRCRVSARSMTVPRTYRKAPTRFLQHLAGGAETFQQLGHAAIDRDDVDDGADFFLGDTVVQRTANFATLKQAAWLRRCTSRGATRQAGDVMREFGIESLSSTQVSRATRLPDDELAARHRSRRPHRPP